MGSVAVLAVLAGNDMVVTTDYRAQIPLVLEAVAEGTISKAMIDQAVERVLGWLYVYLFHRVTRRPPQTTDQTKEALP